MIESDKKQPPPAAEVPQSIAVSGTRFKCGQSNDEPHRMLDHRRCTSSIYVLTTLAFVIPLFSALSVSAGDPDRATSSPLELDRDLTVVATASSGADNLQAVVSATSRIQETDEVSLSEVLSAMDVASPTGINRLIGVATSIMRRERPTKQWQRDYIADHGNPSDARAWLLRSIRSQDLDWYNEFLADSTSDPSPLIRRLAIDLAIEDAEQVEADNPEEAVAMMRQTLTSARHPKQVTKIAAMLRQWGDPLTTAAAMSMIMDWNVVGPFDNVDGVGFDQAYSPQLQYVAKTDVDLTSQYEGKNGSVQWSTVAADDEGTVNLAKHFDKEKGAVAYAFRRFESDDLGAAQLRLKNVTANKVWINGTSAMVNSISHSGTTVDQYVTDFEIQPGENTILIKTTQNEQTQPWAQEWEFQCRITDSTGKGINIR